MKIILEVIFCVLILFNSVSHAHLNDFKLEQVQILVRHGDRTPDKREVYKTDPYDPLMYIDPGYGQLTNTGKLRMYDFGQVLRQMYGSFLSDFRKVYTYSVDSDRIRDSLQQILAGIYPYLAINGNDPRNQIPTHSNTTLEDFFENYMLGTCPKFWLLIVKALKEPKIQREVARNQRYFDHWKISTGLNFTRPVDVWFLFSNIRAVVGMNLPLPSWCHSRDFRKLMEMMVLYGYRLPVHTENLRRISAGPTINEFTNNIISGHGKNMYIYAAHDVNVGAFVRGLDLVNAPIYPDYGHAAIVEKLRRIRDNQVFIRVLYWDSFTRTVIPLRFKNCGYMCPLEWYMKIVAPLLPRSNDCRILNASENTLF